MVNQAHELKYKLMPFQQPKFQTSDVLCYFEKFMQQLKIEQLAFFFVFEKKKVFCCVIIECIEKIRIKRIKSTNTTRQSNGMIHAFPSRMRYTKNFENISGIFNAIKKNYKKQVQQKNTCF